jgi:peptidoglycan L-alanyl-D-glutamate endopeptidase CwlK
MNLTDTIVAVQKKLGLDSDGKAGPATWAAIHRAVVGKNAAADAGLDAIIRAVQKKLGVFVDGSPGPATWGAIHLKVVGKKAPDGIKKTDPQTLAGDGKTADSRSEGNIKTLHPRVRPYARALIERAAQHGIIIKVTSGMRTYAEQDILYTQGRTAPGKIVTYAKGGYSNHNFGLAFDVTIFKGSDNPENAKVPVYESSDYQTLGVLGKDLGLEWGGDWKKPDEPHFQLRPGWAGNLSEPQFLAGLRDRKQSGEDFYAA